MISQQQIKYSNMKRIYTLISRQQTNSRALLAKETGLSKTTISALVEELLQTGYIIENGQDATTPLGRKPYMLEINAEENCVVVIAWHHKRLIGALVNTAGKVIFRTERTWTGSCHYAAQTVSLLQEELLPAAEKSRVLGVCIVVPSMVDDKRQQIISTVLSMVTGNNVVQQLRASIAEYPLAILNDTSCYAYAEYITNRVDAEEFIFVNVAKGIGAVLLSNGEIMRGANGMTTQFGHSSIDRNGPVCECGNRGCLEHMIGEGALARLAEQFDLQKLLPEDKIRFRDVGALVAQDNVQALALVDRIADDLAYGLSNLLTLLHSQMVVIGGVGMNLGDYFLQEVQRKLKSRGFPQFVSDVLVRFACVDENAELPGAAMYYLNRHFSFDGSMRNKLILT